MNTSSRIRVAITGANGHIGLQLISRLIEEGYAVKALVRSARAAAGVQARIEAMTGPAAVSAEVSVVDYGDPQQLADAVGSCEVVVHLVGIIKESPGNTFQAAHEEACQALVDAGLEAEQIICLGIIGSDENSENACLRSRGLAERILFKGDLPATVIRVPMVLGPDDYASHALARNGRASRVFSWRADSLEQPIDSRDVISAILAVMKLPAASRLIELAGPESLSRRDLIARAGRLFGNTPRVISLPLSLGLLLAGVLETLSARPPVTRAMLGVLDHDDRVDVGPACKLLSLDLTPLDETLRTVLRVEKETV